MADFDVLYPNRFLKAGLLKGRPVTLTISKVTTEKLGDENDKKQKVILAFAERPMEMVANKTNGLCLKAMFGRDSDDWVGHKVTIHPVEMPDPFTGEMIQAIRILGSPDLDRDLKFSARLGRKTVTMTVKKTGKDAAKAPAPAKSKHPVSVDEVELEEPPLMEPEEDAA